MINFVFAVAIPMTDAAPQNGSLMNILVPIIGMLALFYFLFMRPQQKKDKEQRKMRDDLKKGDRVLTIGGIYGTVDSVKDNIVIVKVLGNAKIEFTKNAIQNILT